MATRAIERAIRGLDSVAFRTGYEQTLKGGIRFSRQNNPYLVGTCEYSDWVAGFGLAKQQCLTEIDGAPEFDADLDWDETEERITADDLKDLGVLDE